MKKDPEEAGYSLLEELMADFDDKYVDRLTYIAAMEIAGLREKVTSLTDALASITRERDEAREENKRLRTEHEDARTALEDLQIEYGHAQREALELATWLHRTFYADVADWKPFTAASSIMTQIDNMVAGVNQRLINIEKRATKAEAALAPTTRERDALREALAPFAQTWAFSKDAPDARVTCSTENGVLDLPVSAFRAAFDAWSEAGGHAARDSAALVNGEGGE